MRHQPLLFGNEARQLRVDFDTIERREAQTRQFGQLGKDTLEQAAEREALRQVCTVSGKINAGDDHLLTARLKQAPDLLDHPFGRLRAGGSPSKRDDAKGAAVVAAVLHLHKGAGARLHRQRLRWLGFA